jgi:chaperone modulatory protein CbpM
MTYPLVRLPRLSLEQFCTACGMHPDLVRRLVVLGLLEPVACADGRLEFTPRQIHVAARIHRLRRGLGLNYAAVGVVLDLLDRIEELEAALRERPARRSEGDSTWT